MNDNAKMKIVVLVSGRGTNLQAIIDAQLSKTIGSHITMVISNKKNVAALIRAKKANIPSQVIDSKGKSKEDYNQKLEEVLQQLNPDLIVLAGYMKIIPPAIVSCFSNKIINIHPSLLPSFPGLNAQQQALNSGVKITGCTVHFVDNGCDTGPIILQECERIQDNDSEESLSSRLLKKEHILLVQAIQLIENNKVILQDRKTLLREEA
jgi:phosphoribosylglycinamide formyltransferase 1